MHRSIRFVFSIVATVICNGCSLSRLVDGTDVSSETRDPAAFRTAQGAIDAYRGAQVLFARVVSGMDTAGSGLQDRGVVYITGLLTDELRAENIAADYPSNERESIDARLDKIEIGDGVSGDVYNGLHQVRGLAQEARGLVQEFVPNESRDLSAHLYAIEGYANILLADLFCSGIPLSQVHYKGDYTVTRGYTTIEMYASALALFDSASSSIRDSTDLAHLINVGRGRALVAMGRYPEAATAVQHVPDTYRYQLAYSLAFPKQTPRPYYFIVADGDGGGVRFVSDHDPRATLPALLDKTAPLTLSSGIEARLIAVEAAIHANQSDWLVGLNQLRTTCTTSEGCPVPAPAGSGNVGNLAPLIDSTQSLAAEEQLNMRIDLLFRERAYWLFATGHRQGDLRRLVREYGRPEYTVYPSGLWGSRGFAAYGTNTNLAIPDKEQLNPLYRGCLHRDA